MSIDIRLKHSATANKAPQPADLKDGELALNINAASPAAYIKDSAGNIVKLAGAGAIGGTPATETAAGIVELATAAETTTGTDSTRAVHPAGLKVELDKLKLWNRTGTVLSPANAGDNVLIGGTLPSSPNISLAADGTSKFSNDVEVGDWFGGTTAYGARLGGAGHKFRSNSASATIADFFGGTGDTTTNGMVLRVTGSDLRIGGGASGGGGVPWNAKFTRDGYLRIGGTLNDSTTSPNIELRPDGNAKFGDEFANTSWKVQIETGAPSTGGNCLLLTKKANAPATDLCSMQAGTNSGDTTTRYINFRRSDNTIIGYVGMNGASAVNYSTSSDHRLKENVTAVTDGITRLQQLKPSRFNFIADSGKTVDGFIAHEVQAIVPECVTGTKDAVDDEGNPVYQGIDQSKLVPLLTAALQEAVGEIESLKARVAALETP